MGHRHPDQSNAVPALQIATINPLKMSAPTLETLLTPKNAEAAWDRVRRNHGCPGVDGVSIEELEPHFDQQWLQTSRAMISGDYRPQPLLRVRIPKPTGGERLLGIPSVLDRVVQQATTQVLSPCWEPRFSPRSFAYRPGRGTRDALAAVERGLAHGAPWVLHLDIESFFDSVPHSVALSAIHGELSDPRFARLIEGTLKCGVYENGLVRPTTVGLAQGSPLSPLLANVVLHRLDSSLTARRWEFARYADDCVILLPSEAEARAAQSAACETLAALDLRINQRKTRLTHYADARFLGFAFKSTNGSPPLRTVSPESLAEIEGAITRILQTSGAEPQSIAKESAALLRSWLAYFYTPHDEARLRELAERIAEQWRTRFPGFSLPTDLTWDSIRANVSSADHVDYSGHLHDDSLFGDGIDWLESLKCLLTRAARARWWHIEYDLDRGGHPAVRLCIGRHRINLRF